MTRALLSVCVLAGLWACNGAKETAQTEAPAAEVPAAEAPAAEAAPGVASSGVVPAADVGKAQASDAAATDAEGAAATATAPDRAAPTKGALPCEGITSSLAAWMGGAKARVGTDAQGRASVVVELAAAETALPAAFEESARRERTAYGHVAAADVCALATTPGVQSVRAADLADSK